MTLALPGYPNTPPSAAQPVRLWFGPSVATSRASSEWGVCAPGRERTLYFNLGRTVLHVRYWV